MSEPMDRFLHFKRWVQSRLSAERRAGLRPYLVEPLAVLFRRDLIKLATLSGTDKWGEHWYAANYARHFQPLRKKPVTLLEICLLYTSPSPRDS